MKAKIDKTENDTCHMVLSLRRWNEVIEALGESGDDALIRDIRKMIPRHAALDNSYGVWVNEEDWKYIDEIAFN